VGTNATEPVDGWTRALHDSSWRRPAVLAVALAPLLWFPLNLALHRVFPDAYMRIAPTESGALELSQAAFYVAAAIAAWFAASAFARGGRPGLAWIDRLLAAAALVMALEELAWGQTLVDFATPEWWRMRNRQGDLTLHNLHGVHELFGHVAMLASFVLALAWTCVPRAWYARSGGALALLVAPPLTALYFLSHGLFILVLRVQERMLGREVLAVSWQEVFETPLAAGVFVVAELHRRASRLRVRSAGPV
jgi:hypothetical protein